MLESGGLKLDKETLYDRAPAELSLDAFAEFLDASGKVMAERPLQAIQKQRLFLELRNRRCEYLIDPFVEDTSTMLATQFMQEARVLLDPTHKKRRLRNHPCCQELPRNRQVLPLRGSGRTGFTPSPSRPRFWMKTAT